MKKWIFPKIASLMLLLAVIMLSPPPMASPEQKRLKVLDQALQEETKLCNRLKQDNDNLRFSLLKAIRLATDEKKCNQMGEMIMLAEAARILLIETNEMFKKFSKENAFQKLCEIEDKLNQTNRLHKRTIKAFNAFLSVLPSNSDQLRLLEI
jgi:hypothetical protein